MKRIFAFVFSLALMMVVQGLFGLYAASPTFQAGANIPATRGTSVTVPITVSNNPGFAVAGLSLSYDPSVLSITSVTAPVSNMPLNQQFQLTTNPGTQWISFASLTDWAGSGVVANVTFSVNHAALTGTSNIGLSFTGMPDGTPVNSAGQTLGGMALGGSVNIQAGAEFIPPPAVPPTDVGAWPGTTNPPPHHNPIPDNSFIGNPYNPSLASNPSNNSPNSPNNFGNVPQTGVSGIMWQVVGLSVSLIILICSLGYALWLWRKKAQGIANP